MKGIKKILSITLASALIFGVCVFPASAVETDTSQPATVTLQGSLQPFELINGKGAIPIFPLTPGARKKWRRH